MIEGREKGLAVCQRLGVGAGTGVVVGGACDDPAGRAVGRAVGMARGVVMGRTARSVQAARQKARERRVALDVDREARDRRVEDAAAAVFAGLEERAAAEAVVAAANAAIGSALVRLAGEGLGVDAVVQLVDLDAAQVRRLSRAVAADNHPAAQLDTSGR